MGLVVFIPLSLPLGFFLLFLCLQLMVAYDSTVLFLLPPCFCLLDGITSVDLLLSPWSLFPLAQIYRYAPQFSLSFTTLELCFLFLHSEFFYYSTEN